MPCMKSLKGQYSGNYDKYHSAGGRVEINQANFISMLFSVKIIRTRDRHVCITFIRLENRDELSFLVIDYYFSWMIFRKFFHLFDNPKVPFIETFEARIAWYCKGLRLRRPPPLPCPLSSKLARSELAHLFFLELNILSKDELLSLLPVLVISLDIFIAGYIFMIFAENHPLGRHKSTLSLISINFLPRYILWIRTCA